MTEHILVIEDDPIQSESLRSALEHCGYTCDIVASGAAALDRFRRHEPDAILVDLGLPDCDGVQLISIIRSWSQVPVIVISGRCDQTSKVAALDNGADDFVEKPFNTGELFARIRAKLRVHWGEKLDDANHPFKINLEVELNLTRMERALLSCLIKHQGDTVPEQEIIAAIWGLDSKAADADLHGLVTRLRRKLEMQQQPLFVLNERGIGYYVSGWGRLSRRARAIAQGRPNPTAKEFSQSVRSFLDDAVQLSQDLAESKATSGKARLRSARR